MIAEAQVQHVASALEMDVHSDFFDVIAALQKRLAPPEGVGPVIDAREAIRVVLDKRTRANAAFIGITDELIGRLAEAVVKAVRR